MMDKGVGAPPVSADSVEPQILLNSPSPSSSNIPTDSSSSDSHAAPATLPAEESQQSPPSPIVSSSSSFSSSSSYTNGIPENSVSSTDLPDVNVPDSTSSADIDADAESASSSSSPPSTTSSTSTSSNYIPLVKKSITAPTLADLRCLSDFYAVLHFLDLFNITTILSIQNFTIDKLENSLLDCGPFLIDMIIKLLKCISRKPINYDTWEKTLQLLIKSRIGEYGGENPLDTSSFNDLSIKERVQILLALCDWQLDDNSSLQSVLNDTKMIPKLRIESIGRDRQDNVYYYFDMGGTMRLCRQGYSTPSNTTSNKKTTKGKRGRDDIYTNPDTTSWETVAATISEFEDFADTLHNSKNKDEKSLLNLVENTYIPALQAKEKSQQMAQKRMQRLDVSTTNIMSAGRARKSIKYSSFFEDHDDDEM